MEQHPVPQNISSFQFKLIGDITLKQFSYVAGGVILAYVVWKLPLLPALIQVPLAVLTAVLGVGLAFFPVQERPLDRWLGAFIKSIYAPTQFVWRKHNQPPEILSTAPVTPPQIVPPPKVNPVPTPVAREYVATIPQKPAPPKPAPPKVVLPPPPPPKVMAPPPLTQFKPLPKPVIGWTVGGPPPKSKSSIPAPTTANNTPVTGQRVVFEEKTQPQVIGDAKPNTRQVEMLKSSYQELEKRLNTQMQTMQQELAQGNVTKERFMELQQLLTQLLSEKERMSNELVLLRKQVEATEKSAAIRPTEYKTLPQERTTVKIVPPAIAVKMGVPQLTEYPNVVTGFIKDSQGNLLPNIILTVKDKDGLPVRALKTNKLGQFAASTPLQNGVYIIEIEDPKKAYRFERIEVSLSNQVLPPLEISAFSEKDMMRQKLAQEIFSKNTL